MDDLAQLPSELLSPKIPGYEPVRLLGTGAQASVWLVRRGAAGQLFAAKCYAPEPFGADGNRESLTAPRSPSMKQSPSHRSRHNESEITQEWRVLAHFRHEHLISFHEFLTLDDGKRVLITDFAAGGSLSQLLQARGKLSVGETVTLLTPIAQALAYLHAQGVVHADVSPGNILFTAQGKPLLADLGFAALFGSNESTGCGTKGFAPEGGATSSREEVDVYSIAAVGWFALTGQLPLSSKNRPPLALLNPGVPPMLVAALEAALQDDAKLRPSAASLAQAIYRSAKAAPLDLSDSVHPSVIKELLTRRSAPEPRGLNRLLWPVLASLRPKRSLPRIVGDWQARRSLNVTVANGNSRGANNEGRNSSNSFASGLGRRRRSAARRVSPSQLAWLLAAATVSVLVFSYMLSPSHDSATAANIPPEPNVASQKSLGGSSAKAGASPPVSATAGLPPAGLPLTGQLPSGLPQHIERGLSSSLPAEAASALGWMRSHALASGRLELIAFVNAPGSASARADAELIKKVKENAVTFPGLGSSLRVIKATTDQEQKTAQLSVVVTTSPYIESDVTGKKLQEHTSLTTQKLVIWLQRVQGRWMIERVTNSA